MYVCMYVEQLASYVCTSFSSFSSSLKFSFLVNCDVIVDCSSSRASVCFIVKFCVRVFNKYCYVVMHNSYVLYRHYYTRHA